MRRITIDNQALLQMLAAHPEGMKAPEIRRRLPEKMSQPTLSRRLQDLRAQGLIIRKGAGPASRYLLARGRKTVARERRRELHRLLAEKLLHDPSLKTRALHRLEQLRRRETASPQYLDRWESLLHGDTIELLRQMTEAGDEADTLRQASPFSTLLSAREREQVFRRIVA